MLPDSISTFFKGCLVVATCFLSLFEFLLQCVHKSLIEFLVDGGGGCIPVVNNLLGILFLFAFQTAAVEFADSFFFATNFLKFNDFDSLDAFVGDYLQYVIAGVVFG